MAAPLYDLLSAGKATGNEKWLALCRELGPEQVGLATATPQ